MEFEPVQIVVSVAEDSFLSFTSVLGVVREFNSQQLPYIFGGLTKYWQNSMASESSVAARTACKGRKK